MTNELKPCPFCGGEDLEIEHTPTYYEYHPDVYWINCCDCGARGSEEWTEDIAIAAWNTRAERTCQAEYRTGGNEFGAFYCSACNNYMDENDRYCPSCGAKVVQHD